MPKTAPTVAEFLAGLPEERRATMTTLHQAIRKTVVGSPGTELEFAL